MAAAPKIALALTFAWRMAPSLGQKCTSDTSTDCLGTKCCTDPKLKCYEKDTYWAGCLESCKPGINPNDPPQYQTPWTCKLLDKGGGSGKPPDERRRRSNFKPPEGRRRRTNKDMPKAPRGSAVDRHGHLKAKGNRIVDKNDKPVRLRGMSLFWSQWKAQFYTEDAVKWLAEDWKCTVVRAAMAVEHNGYLTNPDAEMKKVEVVVDAAIKVGIYVIIDWHDHNAEKHMDESKGFFNKVAEKYGQYPNALFETYNEPTKQDWGSVIKPYHEAILPVIRAHSQNLVILGTRTWSQDVDVAGRDKVKGENLAYTLHFYASSAPHQAPLRGKATRGLNMGIPLFVTEWGTCEYTGDGKVDTAETQKWLDYLDKNYISDANWAIGDKAEACAALKPGASGKGGWKESELTVSGKFMRDSIRKAAPPPGPSPPASRRRGSSPSPSPRTRRRSVPKPTRRRGSSTRRRSSKSRRRSKSSRRRSGSKRRRRR